MNGFAFLAESYKQLLEKDPNNEEIRKQIKLLGFLGECSQQDIEELYNSSAFNDITKAYCKKAMQNCGVDAEVINNVLSEIKWLHDTVNASDIIKQS